MQEGLYLIEDTFTSWALRVVNMNFNHLNLLFKEIM